MAGKFEPQFHVRGKAATDPVLGNVDEQATINPRGDLLVAQALPDLTECVRLGNSWAGISAAQTPLNVAPTTTAGVSLWSGEAGGGSIYVIDSVFVVDVVTQALVTNMQIMAMINVGVVSKPTGGTLITPKGLTGKAYGGNAVLASGTTVVNDVWFPIGNSVVNPNTADLFTQVDIPVKGLYIVRPGGCFSIALLVANAPVASSVQAGIRWHEVLLPMI
jgi:hypothetical protein